MKMKIKRALYLGYYLKELNRPLFLKFLSEIAEQKQQSKAALVADALNSVFRYNISLLEYFQFHFYEKSREERSAWAGTGFMYEFQRAMNPPEKRAILDDKTRFYKKYRPYILHHVIDLQSLKEEPEQAKALLQQPKVVLKEIRGKCGLGTAFVKSADYTPETLINYMEKKGFDLAESFVQQHPEMDRLSPSGVNTVRIITQLNNNDDVVILGCRQRISVDSPVDNLAAGNIAAPIDEETGRISGPAVYSDITKVPVTEHPVTKTPIVGFQIPFWKECLKLVKDAALEHPQNRSIGWDIVVTKQGPGLIEGNHDWCKLLWQLPVQKGLKPMLLEYV